MNKFIVKVALAALVVALSGAAGAAQAQSTTTLGLSSSWYNTYADDRAHGPKPRPHKSHAGEGKAYKKHDADKKKHVLGTPHKRYFKNTKRRHYMYRTAPRRNVRGYANAPWN